MSGSIIKSAVLGGLVMFVWGVLWWMVLPIGGQAYSTFADESAVKSTVMANAPESGVYIVPGNPDLGPNPSDEEFERAQEEMMAAMTEGPILFVSVHRPGANMMSSMVLSLAVGMLTAGLLAWVSMQTAPMAMVRRGGFVALLAFIGSLMTRIVDWNWWGLSGAFVAMDVLYNLTGWFMVGLVIYKFVDTARQPKQMGEAIA